MSDEAAAKGVASRTIALMRVLAEAGEPQSIKHLSEVLALAPSTLHRLLEELVRAGWVERTAYRRYRPALEFYRLGALTQRHIAPVALAQAALAEIVGRCDETALFAVHLAAESRMVFVDKRDPSHALRYRFRMHEPRSLVWGAPGRAILAQLPEATQARALGQAVASELGLSPPSWDDWREEAELIRRRGYAESTGAFIEWAVAFAAPVFGPGDDIVGALAIAAPHMRVRAAQRTHFIHTLTQQARQLSGNLGAARRGAGDNRETMQ